MSQRHPLLTKWGELGEALAYRLPLATFECLIATLESAAKAELGDFCDGVLALHEIANNGSRRLLSIEELLLLIEARVQDLRAQHQAALRRRRGRNS